MTLPKTELVKGKLLTAAVVARLPVGPHTAGEMAEAVGGVKVQVVRLCLGRLVTAGVAHSARTLCPLGKPVVTYTHLANPKGPPPDAAKAFRPVFKEWTPNHKRDPLVSFLFGAPGMRAAA